MKLTDFNSIQKNKFWNLVDKEGTTKKNIFITLWDKANEQELTHEEAVECLDALFIYSHMRIKKDKPEIAKYYPTKQYTENRLQHVKHLWWVDHFTAGISEWSTLSWFSAQKRKKNNKLVLAGASTHFIQGYKGHPFYIIPLMHGAWHEPRRNKDSISIEVVNAGKLTQNTKNNTWHYWARKIPDALIRELPPVLLDKPYKGIKAMQPFTVDQIKSNIKLKRIIRIALDNNQIEASRMSQHSNWRQGKSDMGVLWPFDECNTAAFVNDPIPELEVIQNYSNYIDDIGELWKDDGIEDINANNPEYGFNTPTHDDDIDLDEDIVLSINQVQKLLTRKGYSLKIDGHMGPNTKKAVKNFQTRWNNKNPNKKPLTTDGIPGPKTCSRLKSN